MTLDEWLDIPSEWSSDVQTSVYWVAWEHETFDIQFAGENRDIGQSKAGPEPHDILRAAEEAAAAFDTIQKFHNKMMAARRGWDRNQPDRLSALSDMHNAILGAIVDGVRPIDLRGWSFDELANVMPNVDSTSALNFTDRFNGRFNRVAQRIRRICEAFNEGVLRGTRRTDNRRDRLIGRLGDIWLQSTGTDAKAGSNSSSACWPFERFVLNAWQLVSSPPPSGRAMKASLERWRTISDTNPSEI